MNRKTPRELSFEAITAQLQTFSLIPVDVIARLTTEERLFIVRKLQKEITRYKSSPHLNPLELYHEARVDLMPPATPECRGQA